MSKKIILTRVWCKYHYGFAFPSDIWLSDSKLKRLIKYVEKGEDSYLMYCEDSYDGGYVLWKEEFDSSVLPKTKEEYITQLFDELLKKFKVKPEELKLKMFAFDGY